MYLLDTNVLIEAPTTSARLDLRPLPDAGSTRPMQKEQVS